MSATARDELRDALVAHSLRSGTFTPVGGSTLQAIDAVVEHGCTVVAVSTLVDRGGELGAELERRGIPYRPVLGAPDLGHPYGS